LVTGEAPIKRRVTIDYEKTPPGLDCVVKEGGERGVFTERGAIVGVVWGQPVLRSHVARLRPLRLQCQTKGRS